jgi:hypothetical protein
MRKKLILVLILVGTAFQVLTVFRSGLACSIGACFWGPNGHDGIWHLALGRQVAKNIPPFNPVFSNTILKNYHWYYDLLLGWLAKLTPFAISSLHFQIIPIVFSFSLGALSFALAKELTGKFWVGFWFAFLNYFANSLGWIINLLRSGIIAGESLFWSMQSASFLLNPPFALSVLILLFGYLLWIKWKENLNWPRIIGLGLLFGLLLNIKAYAAILFLTGSGLAMILKRKKINIRNISILAVAGLAYLITWFLWHRGGSFPFIFKPLWFIRTMFEARDRLYISKLGQIWWTLLPGWLTSPKFWLLSGMGIVIFILGNFNARLFGFLKYKHDFWELNWLLLILFAVLFPLLFIQTGTAWNTIQFLYYGLLFSNYFLAKFLAGLSENKKIFGLFLVVILILGNIEILKTYTSKNPTAYISKQELAGLKFLGQQEGKTILAYPYQPSLKNNYSPPLPLYIYESTAYVSAYTGKQQYVADQMNLEITGFDWESRLKDKKKFFQTEDINWSRGFLLNNGLDYIYLVDDQDINLNNRDLGIKMIFSNQTVKIYQVLK